ncbi:MAG: glycosyl transferase [Candidatus Goldbacteria bacterium]|nr:glycosyl transferase [Candidatus Goldiibacteriota bacterium]
MRFGKFSENGKEYIIEKWATPTPWINYISNQRGYCGIVSQTGGGFSFHRDPRDRRITKYRYNNVPVDRPGRYFYIKDEETEEFWSPTWQPVMKDLDFYECHHGQGYTIIKSSFKGIHHSVLYFVAPDDDCEIWQLDIINNTKAEKNFSIYSYSEFTFWSEPESRNIQWSLHLTKCSFIDDMIIYNFIEPHPAFDMKANKNYVGDRPGFAFMGMSLKPVDFDCSRDTFLGMYNSESNPDGVKNKRLSNSIIRGGVACAALRTRINLQPGQTKKIFVILGFAETIKKADILRKKYSDTENVIRAFEKLNRIWDNFFSNFEIETPDKVFNIIVNTWNPYQCKTTFDWSRYISFYENGEGRGMGTRDSCQDTLSVCCFIPEKVKERIKQIISTTQFMNGDCYHQFFPLGGKGDLKGFSDDHLWLVQMVYAYICETGDISILNEKIPFADSKKALSIYKHLCLALDYTERMKGPNGLPLILTADWNDTLHLWMEAKRPESVLTAELYVYALKQMVILARKIGEEKDVIKFNKRIKRMTEIINKKCWDGEWYLRGFGSEIIGTNKSKKAKIFLNTQAWAILSGVATEERAKICMESVKKYLSSNEGIKLLWPCFDSYDQTYGLISRYNKGRKENGIFAHANAWAIIAETILNHPDRAFDYYKKILPFTRNECAEVLKTEPYVFCQTICSDDALNVGEGANSWLTGTASWMYIAATQYILGVRPVIEGLMIKPCVPQIWKEYKVTRKFRGCRYNIKFIKTGNFSIYVDGTSIKGNVIPQLTKKEANVIVEF